MTRISIGGDPRRAGLPAPEWGRRLWRIQLRRSPAGGRRLPGRCRPGGGCGGAGRRSGPPVAGAERDQSRPRSPVVMALETWCAAGPACGRRPGRCRSFVGPCPVILFEAQGVEGVARMRMQDRPFIWLNKGSDFLISPLSPCTLYYIVDKLISGV